MSQRTVSAVAPALSVRIGADAYVIEPEGGPVTIGRVAPAKIQVADDRISRSHVRVEPREHGWEAIDTSTNGMFVDGVRRNSVMISGPMTIHLGDAEGIPVVFGLDTSTQPAHVGPQAEEDFEEDEEGWTSAEETDPAVARAGAAVAARRRELEITQRALARDKIINAGTLIAFEKGRSWPRRGTLAKLEQILQWPPGTITRIRSGARPSLTGDAEATEVLTNTVQAPLMAEMVELAMHAITAAIAALPKPSDPDFSRKANAILADLRKLEGIAANAARSTRGTPSVVLALSGVRRTYNDLMLRAARSLAATLGQRLYGARHRAELTVEETANAAGVPVGMITTAEAEGHIPPDAAMAIESLIGQLFAS